MAAKRSLLIFAAIILAASSPALAQDKVGETVHLNPLML